LLSNKSTEGGSKPRLEESIEQLNSKNEQAKEAFIGYARFDILESRDRLKFGKWNGRPINKLQLNCLHTLFQVNGVDRFNYAYAIPLVVTKSWLKEGSYAMAEMKGDQLPELRMGSGAPPNWVLDAAGGQHRANAMKEWKDKREKRKAELEAEVSATQRKDSFDAADIDQYNQRLQGELDELRGVLAYGGQWIVALFDSSESCFSTMHRPNNYMHCAHRRDRGCARNTSICVYRRSMSSRFAQIQRITDERKSTRQSVDA